MDYYPSRYRGRDSLKDSQAQALKGETTQADRIRERLAQLGVSPTAPSPRLRQQMKAYDEGRTQAASATPVLPGKHADPKVQIAYEAGHSYGEAALRNGWK
jgi:hypothetical protein